MRVRVDVTGGDYAGRWDEGDLDGLSTTVLVPEGIESGRTIREAGEIRAAIRAALLSHERVVISSTSWEITASRSEVQR